MDQPRRRWAHDADPLAGEEQPTVAGVVQELRRVPLARLLATALIILWAILFARYSWELPVSVDENAKWHFPARAGEPHQTIPIATDAERALFDFRQATAERRNKVGQDSRIILVPYTQHTLQQTAKRSPLDRAILARALANLDRMGAKAIGIDILIDQPQPRSSLDIFRPMGRIILSGRATPIVVWEPAAASEPAERAELTRLWLAFDGGDRSALDAIEQICLTHDKDGSLSAFACRLREAGPGGAIQLREK